MATAQENYDELKALLSSKAQPLDRHRELISEIHGQLKNEPLKGKLAIPSWLQGHPFSEWIKRLNERL